MATASTPQVGRPANENVNGWTYVGPQDDFEPIFGDKFIIVAFLRAVGGQALATADMVPVIACAPGPDKTFQLVAMFYNGDQYLRGADAAWRTFSFNHPDSVPNIHNTELDWLDDFATTNTNGQRVGDAAKIQAALDAVLGGN